MSKAKIEAARILCEVRRGEPCQRAEWNLEDKDCKICDFALLNSRQATALTAGAEVGEKYTAIVLCDRELENKTIERCAQVVEQQNLGDMGKRIAAKLRTLKDKP